MAKLAIEVTHSLRFLNAFLHSINDLYIDTVEVLQKMDDLNSEDKNYGRDLRDMSVRCKEKISHIIDDYTHDYQLFNEDMTDIIPKRNTDEVIYILDKYRSVAKSYEKLGKNINNTIIRYENKKNKYINDKDFIRVISYNKILNGINQIYSMCEHIIGKLNKLINEED